MAQLLAGPSLTTASPSWDIVTVGVTTVFVEKILCLSLQEADEIAHSNRERDQRALQPLHCDAGRTRPFSMAREPSFLLFYASLAREEGLARLEGPRMRANTCNVRTDRTRDGNSASCVRPCYELFFSFFFGYRV